jgi:hypothetical protein
MGTDWFGRAGLAAHETTMDLPRVLECGQAQIGRLAAVAGTIDCDPNQLHDRPGDAR